MKIILFVTILLYNVVKEVVFLYNEGYSFKAASHIALVENNIIQSDNEYIALMED